MILLFQGKVEVVEEHEQCVRTVSLTFKLPSVLRLLNFVRSHSTSFIRFSRENIYVRDNFCCQYCGNQFSPRNLTMDHVVPAVQRGKKSWSNIVAACIKCNQRKGGRTPQEAGMKLLRKPVEPTWLPKVTIKFTVGHAPESWLDYLKPKIRVGPG